MSTRDGHADDDAAQATARRMARERDAADAADAEAQRVQGLRAVALRYEPFAGPPRVIASGRGHVAEALLARAREAGVPIDAQPEVVEVLLQLRIDEVIPPALYAAIAQVLAWAYAVDARVGHGRGAHHGEQRAPRR